MIQVVAATFEDGVLKPDAPLQLPAHARVRVTVEPLEAGTELAARERAWQMLEQLWQQSTLDSHGERLTREQLHERR